MELTFRDLVGERIQLLRRRRGLTQPQLALRCGMGIATLSRIEKGHQSVMGEKIVALARELGTSSDYLLGLSDDAGQSSAPLPPTKRPRSRKTAPVG